MNRFYENRASTRRCAVPRSRMPWRRWPSGPTASARRFGKAAW